MTVDTYQMQPGARFTAIIGGQPSETGQFRPDYPPPSLAGGRLGVQIVPLGGGTPALARTTVGVQEELPGSAIYAVNLTAPNATGDYVVLWDYNGGTAPFFSQSLSVGSSILVTPPSGLTNTPVYVQQADVTADPDFKVSDAVLPADSGEADALIVAAELDIDSILGFWIRDPTTGRKINMTNIVPVAPISPFPGELFAPYQRGVTIYQKAALQRAVIAQVAYRIIMGPDYFIKPQYQTVSGPQFSRSYGNRMPDTVSPIARRHLANMGLVRRQGRAII